MQGTRYFTLLFGIVYLVIGIIGFIPGFRTSPPLGAPHIDQTAGYGYLFGLFPTNALEDILRIVLGIAGIGAAARSSWAQSYCVLMFFLFGLLAVAGFLPTLDTVWGYVPLFSGDTWLNAATSLVAAIFAFVVPAPEQVEPAPAHTAH